MSLLKAAFKRADANQINQLKAASSPIRLSEASTQKSFEFSQFETHLSRYHLMHGWYDDSMHPCYPQVLGLRMQLDLLLSAHSPFPLLGLVHLGNQIDILKPLALADLTLDAEISEIRHHSKGLVVIVTVRMTQQGESVCIAKGEYLYRCSMPSETAAPLTSAQSSAANEALAAQSDDAHFELSPAIGRQYASVSGDYNPIHLWPLTAKLFGFQRNIAHGMHTLALATSCIEKQWRTPFEPHRIDVRFVAAAVLPTGVDLRLDHAADQRATRFQLQQNAKQAHKRIVLDGTVTALHAEDG